MQGTFFIKAPGLSVFCAALSDDTAELSWHLVRWVSQLVRHGFIAFLFPGRAWISHQTPGDTSTQAGPNVSYGRVCCNCRIALSWPRERLDRDQHQGCASALGLKTLKSHQPLLLSSYFTAGSTGWRKGCSGKISAKSALKGILYSAVLLT